MTGKDLMKRAVVRLTYEDFVQFPEDGKRHELIDGEHYVTASPNLKHQIILGNLHLVIGTWLESRPVGRLFLSPFDVVFSDFDVVEPDLLFITANRAADILTPLNVRGAPDLVIEIASKSTRKRDETIKRRLYERSGVVEYWIVDPSIEVVCLYRRVDSEFARQQELSRERGDAIATPLLPELVIPLERVFRDT